MFIVNLCPFRIRASTQLFSWIAIPAVQCNPAAEICFLGSMQQLEFQTVQHASWVYEAFGQPDVRKIIAARQIMVPPQLQESLEASVNRLASLEAAVSTDGFQLYTEFLVEKFEDLRKNENIEGIISMHNDISLERAASYLRIPVIHYEASPFRRPSYKFDSFIIDFEGSTSHVGWNSRFERAFGEGYLQCPMGLKAVREFFCSSIEGFHENKDHRYEVGAILQDDTNMLPCRNGWDSASMLYQARRVFPPEKILIRNHPNARIKIVNGENLGVIDSSESALNFLFKCKRIITINSSMAFEAGLFQLPAYVLGESTFSSISYDVFDRKVWDQRKNIGNIEEKIEFVAFNVISPAAVFMNFNYLRFRLKERSEKRVADVHKKIYTNGNWIDEIYIGNEQKH